MACRRPDDKPLFKWMMVSLLTHKCITRPQRVKDEKLTKNIPRHTLDYHAEVNRASFNEPVWTKNIDVSIFVVIMQVHLAQFLHVMTLSRGDDWQRTYNIRWQTNPTSCMIRGFRIVTQKKYKNFHR